MTYMPIKNTRPGDIVIYRGNLYIRMFDQLAPRQTAYELGSSVKYSIESPAEDATVRISNGVNGFDLNPLDIVELEEKPNLMEEKIEKWVSDRLKAADKGSVQHTLLTALLQVVRKEPNA